MTTQATPLDFARELLLSAFEGVPAFDSRELRLDPSEVCALQELFPQAQFLPLDAAGDAAWYRVQFPTESF